MWPDVQWYYCYHHIVNYFLTTACPSNCLTQHTLLLYDLLQVMCLGCICILFGVFYLIWDFELMIQSHDLASRGSGSSPATVARSDVFVECNRVIHRFILEESS